MRPIVVVKKFSQLMAVITLIVASMDIVGWVFNIPVFTIGIPGLETMKLDTALCFVISGLTLLLLIDGLKFTRVDTLIAGRGLAVMVSVVGLITLIKHLLVYFQNNASFAGFELPGRMPMGAALGFTLLGLALVMLSIPHLRSRSQYLTGTVSLIAGVALLGYLYDVRGLYHLFLYSSMSLLTASLFMLMSLGLLFASPEMRLPRLFNGTGISNSSARRILPPVFLVPIVAGWVILQGEWLGLYSKALGFALFVMLTITLLVGFIYWSIIHLEQLETEKALAEDKFRQVEQDRVALEQGRELVQLREELVMMVSHDLRTPLAVILSSSDMLDRYAEKMNSDQRRLTLKRIKNQIGYMKILIEDATMLNQSSAGKHEFQPHLVNVNEFCMDVVEQIKIIDEGIHQFALDIPVSLPPGQVDDVLLRRILYNLLVNAMKYSPEGGEIRLSVIGSPHLLYFKVSDQGIGIPFKDRDRIFQMFARANNVHQITGSGLGLAIVYESVQIHGGKIDFSSEEGKGTTFTFWLPAA